MGKALSIKHIGIMHALCDGRKRADLREDLGVERYRGLGVKERLRDQEPYRICPECIKVVGDPKAMYQRMLRRTRRVSRVGGRADG